MADFEAIFELDDTDKIDCIFDINATVYNYEELDKLPQINGETLIGNKTSEELHLGSKEDVEQLEQNIQNEATTRAENDTLLQNNINALDEKVDGINVNLTAQIDNLEQDVNTKYNELVNDIDEEIQAREQADNTINQRITDVADELNQTIEENVVALQQEDTALQNQINAHSQTLTAYDTRITNNTNAITQEIADRQAGDNTLQEQVNDNKNLIDTKQDIISDLSTIRSNAQAGYDIIPQVESNTQRIEDLTVARFPNAIIVGTPHIEGGQVSGFSDSNYLQFPFVDISRGLPFDIYFSFTTSNDVNTQQNILDAYFGIALAIQNGKGIMALSSNGTSWDIGMATGTNTLLPNTTYYVKYSWTGTAYSAALSTDDQTYIPDMNLTSSLSPHKTTIFIGGSPNLFGAGSAHPFKGTINFNKSKVVVNGITVWEGMADVGLASRANVSLTNLDEVGENRFNEKQNVTDNNLVTLDKTVVGAVNELDAKIKDIQLFKFPDATIIGTPVINNGQVSGFSSNNYLILPFAFDTKDRAFEINMAFTTGSNVSTTQNLLGGNYCIALLIEGGKLVFRASNNGTNWNVADITTTLTLQPSTNYFVRIYFDKLSYKISYSTNGEDYTQVGYKVTTETPRHGQVFIGVGNNQHNPFLGIINLNKCNIKLNTSIIWQGMDDAGLATRADVSLSNLDELGQAKFEAKQDKLTAGNGIDITDNKISTNTQFNITEDMFDIEYDDTKGVAPYSTSYGYTNVTIHDNAGVEWIEGAIYTFVLDTKVAKSANRNVRVRIGEEGDWKPIMVTSSIASGYTVFVKAINNIFFYKTIYQENGALHCFYDTNTTYTINYMYDSGKYHAGIGKYALSRYSLVMQKPDGTWEKITDTSKTYSTATTKTVNTRGFLLNQIKYYRSTTIYANGALIDINELCSQYNSFTGSYSFNCGSAPGWATGDYIYLVGTIGSDGLFYLDETKWWDNALPTTNDGKIYIQIGVALTDTDSTASFLNDRPIFYNDGTGIKEYIVHDNTKQDVITDLATIRDGASKGATAIQSTADCVKTSGNQTVAGVKTFTGNPVFQGDSYNNILTAKRNDTNAGSYITFSNNTKVHGFLGAAHDKPKFAKADATTYNIVTSTNDTAVGSASKPVYIDANGIATAITSYEGNAATATKSTQDGNGNNIANTYATKTQLATKQDKLTSGSAIGIDNNEIAVKLFDKSKFTVVGSPTITVDGIASGFSTSNIIRKDISISDVSNIEFKLQFTTSDTVLSEINYLMDCKTDYNNSFWFNIRADKSFRFGMNNKDGSTYICTTEASLIQPNTTYNVIGKLNGNTLSLDINGKNVSTTVDATNIRWFNSIYLGVFRNTASEYLTPFKGSIDLKAFSITVDGKEVFNGTQTIYQALDNKSPLIYNAQAFNVVGSPTITNDGIASGFSSNDYLITPINFGNTFKIKTKITLAQDFIGGSAFYGDVSGTSKLAFDCSTNHTYLYVGDGTKWVFQKDVTTVNWVAGTTYYVELSYNGTTYEVKRSTDNKNWTTVLTQDSSQKILTTNLLIGRSRSVYMQGSTDLKQFSITVDGKEVFSGALKGTKQLTTAGFPSDKVTDLALGASGTQYIAPADGWFTAYGTFQQIEMYGTSFGDLYSANNDGLNRWKGCNLPCKKGDTVTVLWYGYTPFEGHFKFIYAEGAK